MGVFVENRSISCIYCGYSPVQGRESEYPDSRNNVIIHECKWICSRCGRLVRSDEVRVATIVPDPIEKKEEKKDDKAK